MPIVRAKEAATMIATGKAKVSQFTKIDGTIFYRYDKNRAAEHQETFRSTECDSGCATRD